jgi:hypothetical protein
MPFIGRKARSTGARLVRERTKTDSKLLERFNSKTAAQGTDARLGARDAGCVNRLFKAVARVQIPLGPPSERGWDDRCATYRAWISVQPARHFCSSTCSEQRRP